LTEDQGGDECLKRDNAPEDCCYLQDQAKNDKLTDSSSVMLATRKESQFPTQGSIWRPPNLVSTVVTDLPEEVLLGKTFLNKQCINKA